MKSHELCRVFQYKYLKCSQCPWFSIMFSVAIPWKVMKYIDLVCAARFGFTLICILFRAEVRALPVQHT